MSAMPKRIRLAPFDVAVVEDPITLPAEHRGEWDGQRLRINVCVTLDPGRKRVTLVHELIHALLEAQGHPLVRGGTATEEEVCDVLAPALVTLVRANPDLVEYLTTRD